MGYIYSFRAQVCFGLSRYQRVATCRNKWINCPFLYKTRCKQSTKCIMIRPTPHGQPYSTNIHIKVLWLNILLCFFICLKTTTECNRKWVFRLKVNDLNVICILLMQRQSITHEKYFLFIFYVCAYLSTEVKPIYHFINLTLNSPTPPGVLSQKSTNYFFTHDDTIILCFHMMYLILWIRSFLLDYLNQISN